MEEEIKKFNGIGVGMPQSLLLEDFCFLVAKVFDSQPYLVGSAHNGKKWRDVDVRVILTDEEYERWGFGQPNDPHKSWKWVSLVRAYSSLGKEMTGLPIDFQIQQMTQANKEYSGRRSAQGIIAELRT